MATISVKPKLVTYECKSYKALMKSWKIYKN